MASEEHADVSVRLPPELEEWLEDQAAETDLSENELVRDLVRTYRSMSENGVGDDVVTEAELSEYASRDDLDGLVAEAALEEALAEQRETFEDQLADVRKRVVQVKRETDGKAAADHDHEEAAERLEALEDDVTSLSESVAAVEDDLESGFENFEDVLEYLTETTDDLGEKTGTLARVLVDVRDELKRLSAREARRAETEALQLAANREGVRSAKCEECDAEVDVALLTVPECPHCASTFGDVERGSGLFSSNRLLTGEPPALPEGDDGGLDDTLESELVDHVEGETE